LRVVKALSQQLRGFLLAVKAVCPAPIHRVEIHHRLWGGRITALSADPARREMDRLARALGGVSNIEHRNWQDCPMR